MARSLVSDGNHRLDRVEQLGHAASGIVRRAVSGGKGREAHLPLGRDPAICRRRGGHNARGEEGARACRRSHWRCRSRRSQATFRCRRVSRARSPCAGNSPRDVRGARGRLAVGRRRLRPQRRSLTRSRVEREAAGHVRGAQASSASRTASRRRCSAAARRTGRCGTATSSSRASATRRSRARGSDGSHARSPRRGSRASTDGCTATRRGSTRSAPRRAGSSGTSSTSARRSRRSSSIARCTTVTSRARPALAAVGTFRRLLRGFGVTTGPVGIGRAPVSATLLGDERVGDVAQRDRGHGSRQRQLPRRDAAQGARRRGRRRAARPPRGAAVVRRVLAEADIPLAGVVIADGSGLSLLDRLTATAIARILTTAWNDPALRIPFWTALPAAGEQGTLEHRLDDPPALGVVRAKTGTTNEASALSGYVRDRFAFVVVQNGAPGRCDRGAEGAGSLRDRARARLSFRLAARSSGLVEQRHAGLLGLRHLRRPGLSPTNTPVVFFETLSDTFAPSASSLARASSRDIDSSVPVITYWFPVSGPSTGRSSSPNSKRQPERAQLLDQAEVVLVGEPLGDHLGPVGAEALDLGELLRRRGDQRVDVSDMAREVLREHPADPGDVQPEQHARERHARRVTPRSGRSRSSRRSRRSRRARAAAPSSAGRGPAASGRALCPRACGPSARRRRRCRPAPRPS